MKLSVIIPTYQRAGDLPRLFDSVLKQTEKPEEVIVMVGPNDRESMAVAEEWATVLHDLKFFEAEKPSVIHSLNLGFSKAQNEIICLLDDDVWLPPDWSMKIREAFEANKKLGVFGGQDYLQTGGQHLINPPLARFVGIFKWYTHIGNHHCGAQKSPVKVDVIKGVNLSFRRSSFIPMQIDPALEGQGAETCWEMDLCLRVGRAGFDIIYDNDNYVLHYWSPRLGFDNRNAVFSPAWPQRIFNLWSMPSSDLY
jgi:glycosyltransferase involved in cell wall biosynthesis